jgi:twinkle protein
MAALKTEHLNWLGSRMLEQDHVEAFRVCSEGDWIAFPYFDPEGNLFAVKYRTRDKKMRSAPECRPGLYGWQAIPAKARKVAIVEGELDAIALAHYGMPTLSVPNGGGGGGKQSGWIEEEFDRLARFDTIYLAMDTDEPGQEAAKEILERLGPERCRIVQLPCKDANQCLQEGLTVEKMRDCFRSAQSIDPEELRRPSEFRQAIHAEFFGTPDDETGFSWPFPAQQKELRLRPGEVVIVAGGNGTGKSQFCGHLTLEALAASIRACIASMEFKPERYMYRLARQTGAIREPSQGYLDHIVDWWDGRLWVFDLVGTAKRDRMLSVFRYARSRYNVRAFIIDNLAKCGIAEDDYNAQKDFVDQLGDFAKTTDSTVILVHHLRKGGDNKEAVKGTGAITDMADTVLLTWRNKAKEDEIRIAKAEDREPDPELVAKPDGAIRCEKQRNGEHEPSKAVWFDSDTFQFLAGPSAKPLRYCPDYQARAVA